METIENLRNKKITTQNNISKFENSKNIPDSGIISKLFKDT